MGGNLYSPCCTQTSPEDASAESLGVKILSSRFTDARSLTETVGRGASSSVSSASFWDWPGPGWRMGMVPGLAEEGTNEENFIGLACNEAKPLVSVSRCRQSRARRKRANGQQVSSARMEARASSPMAHARIISGGRYLVARSWRLEPMRPPGP